MEDTSAPRDGPSASQLPAGGARETRDAPVGIDTDRVWASDLTTLIRDSDLIAVGTLAVTGTEYSRSSDNRFIHVAQPFIVETLVHGDVEAGGQVPVIRTITSDEPPVVEFDAVPVAPGGRYLLFLQDVGDVYVTVGGPQGQFAIQDDVVVAATLDLPGAAELHGEPLEEVLARLHGRLPSD